MKALFSTLGLLLLLACSEDTPIETPKKEEPQSNLKPDAGSDNSQEPKPEPVLPKERSLRNAASYANSITEDILKKHLSIVASDGFEGRFSGLAGENKTIDYLRTFYKKNHIEPLPKTKDYLEHVPKDYIYGVFVSPYLYPLKADNGAHNLIAYIEGAEKPGEFVVVTAHMDHMGNPQRTVPLMFNQRTVGVHNGADDNGSGTVAIMLMAKAFQEAAAQGLRPRRSLVFAHFTAEELGLIGSRYFVNEGKLIEAKAIVANVNLDMVGMNSDNIKYNQDDNYVYVIGSDKSSTELKQLQNRVNAETVKMDLDYSRDDASHKDNTFARSDHYNFALKNIPVVLYHSGLHSTYHTIHDDAEHIAYKALMRRTQLAFYTTWEIANKPERLKVDKQYKPSPGFLSKQRTEVFRCLGHP